MRRNIPIWAGMIACAVEGAAAALCCWKINRRLWIENEGAAYDTNALQAKLDKERAEHARQMREERCKAAHLRSELDELRRGHDKILDRMVQMEYERVANKLERERTDKHG